VWAGNGMELEVLEGILPASARILLAPSTAGSPAPSQSTTERTPARRSRRVLKKAISADTQAYKPPVSSGGESSEDELENLKMRRKSARGGMKGLKRRRTEGTGDSPIPSAIGGAGDRDALCRRDRRGQRGRRSTKSSSHLQLTLILCTLIL
jgi:hypothetical protein